MHHEVIHGPSMPQSMEHHSQAVRAGELVFVAGQPGIDLGVSSDPANCDSCTGGIRGRVASGFPESRGIIEGRREWAGTRGQDHDVPH
jgi:hypothetical protein